MAVEKRMYFTTQDGAHYYNLLDDYGFESDDVIVMESQARLPVISNREPNRPGFSNPRAWLEDHKYGSYIMVHIFKLHTHQIVGSVLVHGSVIKPFSETCLAHGMCHDDGEGQPRKKKKRKPRGTTYTHPSGAKITYMAIDDLENIERENNMMYYKWFVFNAGVKKSEGEIIVGAEKLEELNTKGLLVDEYIKNKTLVDYGVGLIEGDEVFYSVVNITKAI